MRRRNATATTILIVLLGSGVGASILTFTNIGPLRVTLIVGTAAITGVLAYGTLRHPAMLEQKVRDRTQELQTSLIDVWLQKRELQAARDHLGVILAATPDAVVGVGGDGSITAWNAAAERLYGWSREEVLGEDVSLLIDGDRHPVYERHEDELRGGEPVKSVVSAKRKDGSVFDAEVHLAAYYDGEESLRTVVGVVRDVTEDRLVETACRALRSSLDAPEAMRAFARVIAGQIDFEALVLCVVEEERIRRVACVAGDGTVAGGEVDLPSSESFVAEAIHRRTTTIARRPDDAGVVSPLGGDTFAAIPILNAGNAVGALVVGFGTSPAKHIVSLLERVTRAVVQEVVHIVLYNRQRQISEKLRELDELKSDFLSTVSHEIRTPLAAITGFSATLEDHWDRLDPDTRRAFIRKVLRKAAKLEQLIDDLLDFSRLERGTLELELRPCELHVELQRAIDRLDGIRGTHGIRLEADGQMIALADHHALARVVDNLLLNAAKFSPSGSRITVRTVDAGPCVVVCVEDEGEGIPPSEQERIFDRFYRLERGDRSAFGGTGIGLAIVKELVRAQGGEAWVESEPGHGSAFCFTLRKTSSTPDAPGLEITDAEDRAQTNDDAMRRPRLT